MADWKDHPVAKRIAARRAAQQQEEDCTNVKIGKVEALGVNSIAIAAACYGDAPNWWKGKVSVKCDSVKAISSSGGQAQAFAYLGPTRKNVEVEVGELVADSSGDKKKEVVSKEPIAQQQQQPSAPPSYDEACS